MLQFKKTKTTNSRALTCMFWHPWQNASLLVPVEYVLIKDNSLT